MEKRSTMPFVLQAFRLRARMINVLNHQVQLVLVSLRISTVISAPIRSAHGCERISLLGEDVDASSFDRWPAVERGFAIV